MCKNITQRYEYKYYLAIGARTRILHRCMSENIMQKYVSEQIIADKYAYLCEHNQ